MSIFDKKFKLDLEKQKANAINVLMEAVHNKLTYNETNRVYDILSSQAMSKDSDFDKVKSGMQILSELKGDWLTHEEKKNLVAGVWLCECRTDSKNNKGISFITPEELDYTKKAILGKMFF